MKKGRELVSNSKREWGDEIDKWSHNISYRFVFLDFYLPFKLFFTATTEDT